MESLASPPPLKLNYNHVESWKLWKQRFQLHMDATSLNAKPESHKIAILLHVIGEENLEIYNTFNEVSSASMNEILAKFELYFVPQRNITYERQSDFVLVDQLVRGLRESRLRERLLRVPDLDIKKAADICRAAETSKLQAQVYFTEERSIDAIKRFKPSPEVKPRATGQANKFRQPAKRQESSGRKCHYCGSHHVPGRCPAYGKQCRSCGKRNHFSRVCKLKSVNRVCQNNPEEFTNSANSCKYPPEQFFVSTIFLVTKNSYQPILGLTASADKLGLIKKCDNVNSVNCCKSISNLLCKYNQVFEGLGNLPGKDRITLCENSVPVVSVTRKVAFSLPEPLKAELDRMVKAGVIKKVTELTDWVSPLVIVQKKNGAFRVCLDPQNLNRAIKRPQYNLPTFEDITSKLAGAKYFSVLDAVSAFWQISLDEDSSHFCTFSSPFGKFKFLRMPYGIKCAPERFQSSGRNARGYPEYRQFFDDLIVSSKTLEESNETLEKNFKRCTEFNLKLSKEKSQICQTRVTLLGHTLSSDGIVVDKSKLEPILSMSKPEDRKSLHRYLGMINYLSVSSKFVNINCSA
ncbi:Uncharacterized protein K02A2.6 [Araneus ventricosus]|uniref:Uncharacterized protein K02A2.6 n=1 Tax=Araneus ventricosus TaxID=182803 RepID=A0A4Y2T4L3_ARAVE|nr:Uncharacterized protein K02A2.6 [Araneus ventricosus]